MPRQPRIFIPGRFYHIYNRGNRKSTVYLDRRDRKVFLGKIDSLLSKRKFDIVLVGYCLMDNHYHLVLRQGFDESISVFMQRLITTYARYFNGKYDKVGHVFQGRFQSKLLSSERDLTRLLRYLQKNPLEAGYVNDPDHYAWLSIPEGSDLPRARPSRNKHVIKSSHG